MTTTAADWLLADVLADPADDAPRLILADWLEDNGQPERAEFIRVQVELARLAGLGLHGGDSRSCPCDPCRLRRLVEDLFAAAHLGRWFPRRVFGGFVFCLRPLAGSSEADAPFAVLRRGFVAEVCCPERTWLDHGAAVVRRHPVERVRLAGKDPRMSDSDDRGWWFDAGISGEGSPAGVAAAIFRRLPDTPGRPETTRHYSTIAEALDALSAACLACARGRARRPRRPPPRENSAGRP